LFAAHAGSAPAIRAGGVNRGATLPESWFVGLIDMGENT
jgi:hypothetical protein